jgi:hypothetical protein
MDLVGLKTDCARTSHNILAVAQKITYMREKVRKHCSGTKTKRKEKKKQNLTSALNFTSIHLA